MSCVTHPFLSSPWRERLIEKCQQLRIEPPVFQVMSEIRGGRTAWSSVVKVQGQYISARFWYDGKNVNNAMEDAAEVAFKHLSGTSQPASPMYRLGDIIPISENMHQENF
ncbi:hypothetical protein BGHDH14_bgh02898 [Blumeria hordei DH14]|uniref:DRBM domain-containing protein n=1 Tax=Blumeria graminis f. sp. hordei (strain DH14) TaxID=546991 RepID=N1JBE5_BLUG1|nr:hypothetical protein BGHDH14_bgh02898 [Blumeria hordei DH14]